MIFWEFPLSLLVALAYLCLIALTYCWRDKCCWLQLLTGRWASVGSMLILTLLLMVEGTWALRLQHSAFFIGVVLLMMIPLGVTALSDIRQRRWRGALCHAGFFLVLWSGLFGAPDTRESQRVVSGDELQDFRIDYYEDGISPKQYTSRIAFVDDTIEVSVNHPARYHGSWIYQADYDHAAGRYVVLKVVRDPWLWLTYIGFVLMALGAIADACRAWHSWKVVPVALVLAALFTAASLARIHLGTLMPALRSIWFFPHILIYMIAYSLLAISLILSIVSLIAKRSNSTSGLTSNSEAVSKKLLTTASSLLLIGMLCGAVWAKQAWGQYWTWDAKECWAAVTWLLTIVASHLPNRFKASSPLRLVVILLAFAAMQITWYGVNYLPAAQYSMHTYNQTK